MREKPGSILAEFDAGDTIPKIIHQTFGSRSMPDVLTSNIENIRRTNPEWEYRFYDDDAIEAFIGKHYGKRLLLIYRSIDPSYGAARADLFRYLVVYRFGGVYLDIKSRFLVPIDEVISGDERYIISQWSNAKGERYEGFGLKPEGAHIAGGELQQWHVIAAPGHPFLRAVLLSVLEGIKRYRPWRQGTGKVGVMNLTGPMIYTLTIVPMLESHRCKVVRNESALSLDYSVVANDGHKRLFGQHYSENERPVVRPSGRLSVIYAGYQAGRVFKRTLLSRVRPHSGLPQ